MKGDGWIFIMQSVPTSLMIDFDMKNEQNLYLISTEKRKATCCV